MWIQCCVTWKQINPSVYVYTCYREDFGEITPRFWKKNTTDLKNAKRPPKHHKENLAVVFFYAPDAWCHYHQASGAYILDFFAWCPKSSSKHHNSLYPHPIITIGGTVTNGGNLGIIIFILATIGALMSLPRGELLLLGLVWGRIIIGCTFGATIIIQGYPDTLTFEDTIREYDHCWGAFWLVQLLFGPL